MQSKRKANMSLAGWMMAGLLAASLAACTDTPPQTPSPLQSPPAVAVSPIITPIMAAGLSHAEAAPLGATVAAEDGLQITVLEVKRDATDDLISINPFNMVNDNEEAVMVNVRVEITRPLASEIALLPIDFDIADETGAIYSYPLTVIIPDQIGMNLQTPMVITGNLAFILPRGHTQLAIHYLPKNREQTYSPRWLALTPQQ